MALSKETVELLKKLRKAKTVEDAGNIINEVGGFRQYLELIALNQRLMKEHIELE